MSYKIRLANVEDTAKILEIYVPFITDTAISFEYTVPSEEEFAERIISIGKEYPYLVCEENDTIIGYAYAHRYLERAAYQWDVEVTVYLSPEAQGKGIGIRLYAALEALLYRQGIKNLYSCITASNTRSIRFHEAAGYNLIGTFKNAGYKSNAWQDVVWMEKAIAAYEAVPVPPQPITALSALEIDAILAKYK